MEFVILAGTALLLGVVGLLFFRLADERLQEHAAVEKEPEAVAETEAGAEASAPPAEAPSDTVELLYGPEPGDDGPHARWRTVMIVCMFLCNIGLAIFRRWFYHDPILSIVTMAALCTVLWPCAWADIRARLIPNRVLLFGLLLRLALLGAEVVFLPAYILYDLLRCAIAAAALLAVSLLCRLIARNAIGYGDIKLLMLMGFYLGTDGIWGSVFCSMAIAFVYSAALLITKRASLKSEIPFAPILALGTAAAAFLTSI